MNDRLLRSSCVVAGPRGVFSTHWHHPVLSCSSPASPRPPPLTGGPFPTLSSSPHLQHSSDSPPERSLHANHPLLPTELLLQPVCYIQTGICCPPEWSPFPIPRTWFWPFHMAPWPLTLREIPALSQAFIHSTQAAQRYFWDGKLFRGAPW